VVKPPAAQSLTNPVYVHADESNRVATNDSASLVTTIVGSSPGPPGGGATSTAPVYRGKQRLYTGNGAKRKVTGFQITFSGALDLISAINRSHYQLSQPGRTKRSVPKAIALKKFASARTDLPSGLHPARTTLESPFG
jgi:hypothetical protein